MAGKKAGLTYASAGVDTDAQKAAIRALAGSLRFSRKGRGAPLTGLTHFAGLVDFGDQALAICTDGVGTKMRIAEALDKWDTVGIDCIAMNVNDCICVGAEPLAFVDYLACDVPDADVTRAIGVGLDEGARQANVTLAGGETAILPEIVNGWDLAGACVGVADKAKILDGTKVRKGDVIIGLASTGLHSNGYTLARRILKDSGHRLDEKAPGRSGGKRLGEVLLEPTRIYVRPILDLLAKVDVHGLANITGGGLKNLPRMNPRRSYRLTDPLSVPPIFPALQEWGQVDDREMYQTFNMGMGFAAVVPASAEREALRILRSERPKVVGEVGAGQDAVHQPTGLSYPSKT